MSSVSKPNEALSAEQTPISSSKPTGSRNDAEGAGNTFTVTTLPLGEKPDFSKDFFGKQTALAVSGQLEGETFALAFSNIYTFGPTFRAENSNTKTHAAEFWMNEPEMAFCDLNGLMEIEEDFLKSIVKYVLDRCPDELKFLDGFTGGGLLDKLTALTESSFARITHEEAITILRKAMENGTEFQFTPEYGGDTAKEHEKYLTEEYFHSPVLVYDWPKEIKSFYMYQNDDGKTVRGRGPAGARRRRAHGRQPERGPARKADQPDGRAGHQQGDHGLVHQPAEVRRMHPRGLRHGL